MRINHLEESLISIQNEDESLLGDTSKKELDIRFELTSELLINNENNNRIQKLMYVTSIKENKLRLLYFLLPIIEIPLAIIIIIMTIIASTSLVAGVPFYIIAGIILINSAHNINIKYKKISNDSNIIKRIFNTIGTLFTKKDKHNQELEYYLKMNEISNNRLKELTNILNELISKKESLIDELENIEGYIMGVQKIINHNIFDSVPDNNFAVEFVNLRLSNRRST